MAFEEDQIQRIIKLRDKQKLSVVFEMPDISTSCDTVSRAEIDFFKENGFFVKKGLLDPSRLSSALDKIWHHMLDKVAVLEGSDWQLSRDDSATWMNPQWAEMDPHPTSGPFLGRQPIEQYGRILKMHDIGNADYLLELLPNNPAVRQVAEALLTKNLRPSRQTRGVYAIFPTCNPEDPEGIKRLRGASLGPHMDQVCQQLNTCAYLVDVTPRNGGFTLYPGSHKIMFQANQYESNWSPLPCFEDAMEHVIENIEPYEIIGNKGDVIFWHGRMVHSSGIHIGHDIRWAIMDDFSEDEEILTDEEHRQLGQFEWFKNTKLFRTDRPTTDDMWRNWRLAHASD